MGSRLWILDTLAHVILLSVSKIHIIPKGGVHKDMKKRRLLALAALLSVAFLAALFILTAAADSTAAYLPGITSKDDYPNGCVDCHKKESDKNDYRLITALAQIKGHPDVAKIVKKVPNDCALCHKGGSGKAPALSNLVHEVHFTNAAKNAFVTVYKGACLNCHQLTVDTGDMKVKSGAANW